MAYYTTDERVHALRVSFERVMLRTPPGTERARQLEVLLTANHRLPKNAEQARLQDDLLAALQPELAP